MDFDRIDNVVGADELLCHIPTFLDVLTLKAVCRSWRLLFTHTNDRKAPTPKAEEATNSNSIMIRRAFFYAFLASILLDTYFSQAVCLDHLTLWSFVLHTVYFELHLPTSFTLARILHGPSFCGAHALFIMYAWTLIANPSMEFDLAPEGRSASIIYARGIWLHLGPVLCHWLDFKRNANILREAYAYNGYNKSHLFQFWSCLGYFAMGLTWEQVNGDAAGTYNVQIVTPETYVIIGKVAGVASCIVAFASMIKPKLLD
jgi:hypothetical protein